MTKRLTLLLLVLLGFPRPGGAEEISRKILAFYDPRVVKDAYFSKVHQAAEVWLNHLGMEVIHRSIVDPLPDDAQMKGVRGVLAWFEKEGAPLDEDAYCRWLDHQMKEGRRVVLLDDPGFFQGEREEIPDACAAALKTLGLDYGGLPTKDPLVLEVVEKDPAMVEFERPLAFIENPYYRLFRLSAPGGRSYLKVRRLDVPDSDSSLVVTTPMGGYVHRGYVLFEIEQIDKKQWKVNPLLFFEEAFGLKGLPRPDATTVNGRRIFYSQIDGDGIFNVSHIDQKSFSGEIIDREIIKKYHDLPITVSIITGYLDMPEYKNPRVMDLYRSLFSSPNVEPAAHGYTHPLVWRTKKLALDIPGYRYDPDREIKGSVDDVNALLKSLGINKTTNLFQWTGDCLPYGEDIARLKKGNLIGINGGGGFFDRRYESSAYLFPLGILRGDARQIYASSINEDPYTNLWQGPYYGYRDVIETLKNTEDPIRLKPIDIYYHFFSGERSASLKALQSVYEYALSQEIFPMFTSEYARLVEDFFRVRMEAIPGRADLAGRAGLAGGFRISEAGRVKTIRFDHEVRGVDLVRSKGVSGFVRLKGSLYVSLDDSADHEIYLECHP